MLAAEKKVADDPALSDTPIPLPALSWKQIIEPVDPFLCRVSAQLLQQVQAFEPEIAAYAHYALNSQGKQLRPALVILSADATGKVNSDHVTIAVIIEMVHLATLVHDDVLDGAEIRRSRPTLAANWGNEVSVLLGDCLFAHALELAASFPTPDICRAVSAATNTVCSGEILQTLRQRNFQCSRAEYFKILKMKTAELFALSCELGGSVQGSPQHLRRALRDYGLAFGTAYQIYDDCLDLFGSESSVGKSLGTDLVKGKLTLPLLVALERADSSDKAELQESLRDWDAAGFPRLLELLEKYQALEESRVVIRKLITAARQALGPLPATLGRASLLGLTSFLSQQTDRVGVSL
jgi:octaprenyl-diphosphate synthase